ncbi:MAG TPA: CHASE domain-containing protein [Methylophilaceae bacterium]|nr:CHASE domain-containing protein [Methylophilaceae bacterium]
MAKPEPRRWQGYALLAAGALLALGFLLGHYNSAHGHGDQRTRLLTVGGALSQKFNADLQHTIDSIEATAWLIHANRELDRDTFQRFAEQALQSNPDIRELRWSPRVGHADRSAFVARMREQGLADFDVTEERPGSGKRIVAARRDEYFPVLYTAPMRMSALGLDTYSLTDDRWAMHAALEQRKPFASSVQAHARQPRMMTIHVPVFAQGEAAGESASAANLVGYVTGVVTLDRLLTNMRQEVAELDADLLLLDSTNKTEQLLAYLPGRGGRVTSDEAATEYRILKSGISLPVAVAGRQWMFVMQPRSGALGEDMLYIGILLISLLLTGLLVIWIIRGRMDRVTEQ